MAKFRFPLEPLLDVRRKEEDARKRELGALEAARRGLEDQLRARQSELGQGKAAMRDALVGTVDAALLRQQAAATMAVDRLARRTVLELAGLSQRIEAARQTLVAAAQRRRAVEILKERRLEEWKQEADRKETAFLDDLANAAASRKAIEERDRESGLAGQGIP